MFHRTCNANLHENLGFLELKIERTIRVEYRIQTDGNLLHGHAKKASDLFVKCLEREHIIHVFGVPGEESFDLIESLRTSSFQLVVTRQEQRALNLTRAATTSGRSLGGA